MSDEWRVTSGESLYSPLATRHSSLGHGRLRVRTAPVIGTVRRLRLRVEYDRMRVTLPSALLDDVTHRAEPRHRRIGDRIPLEVRHVRQPLVMQAGSVDRLARVH